MGRPPGCDPRRWGARTIIAALTFLVGGLGLGALVIEGLYLPDLHQPAGQHADQAELKELVAEGQGHLAFQEAFELGDELFEASFNVLDGVGAHFSTGARFTRVPRADLNRPGEWATHVPARTTGPNAESCNACHRQPTDDGAGPIAVNVHRDPKHTAHMASFIQRNTVSLLGIGALQRLAEEMTATLHGIRDEVGEEACASGRKVTRQLRAKDVDFGQIQASPSPGRGSRICAPKFNMTRVSGVDADLVVRPFQWKGSVGFLRDFTRDASHNELGMQAVELVGDDVDGDFDGVKDEFTIGDMTALTIYMAAQPRPTSRTEMASLGLIPDLDPEETAAMARGAKAFQQVGCAACHMPALTIDSPIFSEPSQSRHFRDTKFPAGQDPIDRDVDPFYAVTFDLTKDQPDNVIRDAFGDVLFRLGSFTTDATGRAVVELFGDLKRHDMGPGLAEPIDEVGTGASTFLTENLWGVGSTAPYLHDGRATTLAEAIVFHGGEAEEARDAFLKLSVSEQTDLIAFLQNLVLFKEE